MVVKHEKFRSQICARQEVRYVLCSQFVSHYAVSFTASGIIDGNITILDELHPYS